MYTSHELNKEFIARIKGLDDYNQLLEERLVTSAQAKHDYRKAKAMSYPNTTGTVDDRKAQVDIMCEGERLSAYLADALARAAVESVRCAREQLNALQSVGATMRAEMALAKQGPGP